VTAKWTTDSGSLLDLAEKHNVDIEFGCRAGNCGACVTAIIKGDVEYLSEPGEMPEAGSCLACVSTPKGDLEFDA
jgi:ferredoxin